MSELRRIPMPRALHRPQLLWGGERIPMIALLVLSVGVAVTSMNLVGIISGMVVAVIGVYGLRQMAKADPLMVQVYLRYARLKEDYAPHSRPSRVSHNERVY